MLFSALAMFATTPNSETIIDQADIAVRPFIPIRIPYFSLDAFAITATVLTVLRNIIRFSIFDVGDKGLGPVTTSKHRSNKP